MSSKPPPTLTEPVTAPVPFDTSFVIYYSLYHNQVQFSDQVGPAPPDAYTSDLQSIIYDEWALLKKQLPSEYQTLPHVYLSFVGFAGYPEHCWPHEQLSVVRDHIARLLTSVAEHGYAIPADLAWIKTAHCLIRVGITEMPPSQLESIAREVHSGTTGFLSSNQEREGTGEDGGAPVLSNPTHSTEEPADMTKFSPLPPGGSDSIPYELSPQDEEYYWAAYNPDLAAQYPVGDFVAAVYNRQVLAVAPKPNEAMAAALKHPACPPNKDDIILAPILGPPLNPEDTVVERWKKVRAKSSG